MGNDSLAETLRALAAGDKNRSETARLRDVFDEIERALAAGVSRAAIVEALHQHGFSMGLKSFASAVYRIRKQRAFVKKSPTAIAGSPTQPVVQDAVEVSPARDDLSGLDKKQRRERLADQFIRPESTNPLLRRIKKEQPK